LISVLNYTFYILAWHSVIEDESSTKSMNFIYYLNLNFVFIFYNFLDSQKIVYFKPEKTAEVLNGNMINLK